MKKSLLFVFALTVMAYASKATDLIVEEFGSAPTYSSIAAAVAAAVDGDRIIIKNRAGAIPWVEDISITKSLDFLPYTNDSVFVVQGTYTITGTNNKTINIIGMYNANGDLTVSGVPTSGRSTLRVLGSQFVAGSIIVDLNNYDFTLYGSKLNAGRVTYRHGNIMGNDISYTGTGAALTVNSETTLTTDTSFIYGNRINSVYTSSSACYGIQWNSNSMFMDIRNNFIFNNYRAIEVGNMRASSAAINKIYNNTVSITTATYGTVYAIYVSTPSSAISEIMNNLVDKNTTSTSWNYYGIYSTSSGGQTNCYFNYVDNSFTTTIGGTFTVSQNNTLGAATVNSTSGASSSGVDLGNPANLFYDLDLTRNDIGCYGGSFTQNNYFPQFTGSARVFLTSYPYNIRSGNTLSIKATSFDR